MFEGREETVLPEPPPDQGDASTVAWAPSMTRSAYDAAIGRIHQHIAAGETYQVNFTLRLRAEVDGDPRGLYRDLCFAQRGAYAGYLDTGRFRVLSASPELFFRIDGHRIETKPMKGTAPRGRWLAEDEEIRAALQGSVKERAENAMIVDLLRNDLGRVARAGSVTWTDVFAAERYETVWQLTSTVAADLRGDASLVDVFRALFPCGSVTGAPKVSTMGIVAALEHDPRGAYCGTVGYLAPAGAPGPRARFNVAIRTVVHDAETAAAVYGVGGGITWDSQAGAEYDETVAKARVLTERRPPFRLLETLAHLPTGGYRRLDEHRRRLRASAAYLGIPLDEAAVEDGACPRGGPIRRQARARAPAWWTGAVGSRSDRRPWRICRNRFGWPSTVTIRSIPQTRCCSTRRPRAIGTTRRWRGSPTPTTSCSSTSAARSPRRPGRTSRSDGAIGGSRRSSTPGCSPAASGPP